MFSSLFYEFQSFSYIAVVQQVRKYLRLKDRSLYERFSRGGVFFFEDGPIKSLL
ncbi:hypothetical protein Bca101_020067 [Brassica carinata]